MFYVICQSTDMRCPMTRIKKFTSLRAAKKYAEIGNGKYTYDNPEEAMNWHHTFNSVCELKGRINKKDSIFKDKGSSFYPRYYEDNLAYYIREYGYKIVD